MKFVASTLIAALGLSSEIISATIPLPVSTVSVLQGYVGNATTLINSDLNTINNAITASTTDVSAGAQAQLAATFNAQLADIVAILADAGNNIAASTTGAATALTQGDVTALQTTIQSAITLITSTQNTLAKDQAGLTANTQTLTSAELKVLQAAIPALVVPLVQFAQQVTVAGTTTGGSGIAGLQQTTSTLVSTISGILGSLGIPTASLLGTL